MRVYVASGLKNFENVKRVQRRAIEVGGELTYDWTTHGSVGHLGPERVAEVARNEERAVERADVLIALLPGPDVQTSYRGTHVELGIAMALGTPIIVHSEDTAPFRCDGTGTPCAFYFNRSVLRVVGSLDWFVANLGRLIDHARGGKQPKEVYELLKGSSAVLSN